METYKTFKSSNEENKVESFLNQNDEILYLVVVSGTEYSLEYFEDETAEERRGDFLAEYSENENSLKAIELIEAAI